VHLKKNQARANILIRAYTQDVDWQKLIDYYDEMSKITKSEIIEFANKNFNDNYVVIYKREGEDKEVYKVDKPSITANKIVRDVQSEFCEKFTKIKSETSKPEFVDFAKKIESDKINENVTFKYIKNNDNPLFSLYYIFKLGSDNDKEIDIALKYLSYLGTEKYTPEA
jgi:zinc protease